MGPDLIKALQEEEASTRQRGNSRIEEGHADLAYADHLQETISLARSRSEYNGRVSSVFPTQATAMIAARDTAPAGIIRIKRVNGTMSQSQACAAALTKLGAPSHIDKIAGTILESGYPVKFKSVENLRSAMCRAKDSFESSGNGIWGLAESAAHAPVDGVQINLLGSERNGNGASPEFSQSGPATETDVSSTG